MWLNSFSFCEPGSRGFQTKYLKADKNFLSQLQKAESWKVFVHYLRVLPLWRLRASQMITWAKCCTGISPMLKAKCKMIGAGKWRKKAAEPIIKIIFK